MFKNNYKFPVLTSLLEMTFLSVFAGIFGVKSLLDEWKDNRRHLEFAAIFYNIILGMDLKLLKPFI
jgi:hypothetical protein